MSEAAQSIHFQASDFAARISRIAKIFGGEQTADYQSELMPGVNGWLVEIHNNQRGFLLSTDEEGTLLVQAGWTCTSDRTGQWLKVVRSSFGVFFADRPNRPLFRYDFDDRYGSRLPKAHIHFQTDHPEMNPTQAMRDTEESLTYLGVGSQRARRRRRHKKLNVSDLHFPVGGTRFRPALENLLLMMLEEYGVIPDALDPVEAVNELKRSLLDWRIAQAKAVIRDMPLLAIDHLESEGFRVDANEGVLGPNIDPREYFKNRTERLMER